MNKLYHNFIIVSIPNIEQFKNCVERIGPQMAFGDKLKEIREQQNLSQLEAVSYTHLPLPSLDNPEEESPDCTEELAKTTEIAISTEESASPNEYPLSQEEENGASLPSEEPTDHTTEKQ